MIDKKYSIKFFVINYSLLLFYKMKEGKITKETELVRLDACVMNRVKSHKRLTHVTLAGFIEDCIQKELGVLYPDGFIPEKK